jgi:chromosomal replication initiator protein
MAQRCQLSVPLAILRWLAERLAGSGRVLAGAIDQLRTLSRSHHPLTLEIIQEHFAEPVDRISLPRIVRHVSRHFRLDEDMLRSSRRLPSILWPRQIGMFLARRLTGLSLQNIGRFFGGRDHSTVLHACRKVERVLAADPIRSGPINALQAELA